MTKNSKAALHKTLWFSAELFKQVTSMLLWLPILFVLVSAVLLFSVLIAPLLTVIIFFSELAQLTTEHFKEALRVLLMASVPTLLFLFVPFPLLFLTAALSISLALYPFTLHDVFPKARTDLLRVWHGQGMDRAEWGVQQEERDLRALITHHEAQIDHALDDTHPEPMPLVFENPKMMNTKQATVDSHTMPPHVFLASFLHKHQRNEEALLVLNEGKIWVEKNKKQSICALKKKHEAPPHEDKKHLSHTPQGPSNATYDQASKAINTCYLKQLEHIELQCRLVTPDTPTNPSAAREALALRPPPPPISLRQGALQSTHTPASPPYRSRQISVV